VTMTCCNKNLIHAMCLEEFMYWHSTCLFCTEKMSPQKLGIPPKNTSEDSPFDSARKASIEKKRVRQEEQAVYMKRQRELSVEKRSAKAGDLVSLKLDIREATQSHAVLGIVLATSGGGGAMVITKHGIIANKSHHKATCSYIPVDRYLVMDELTPMDQELKQIRNDVLVKKSFSW
jgi:hypothetical protein